MQARAVQIWKEMQYTLGPKLLQSAAVVLTHGCTTPPNDIEFPEFVARRVSQVRARHSWREAAFGAQPARSPLHARNHWQRHLLSRHFTVSRVALPGVRIGLLKQVHACMRCYILDRQCAHADLVSIEKGRREESAGGSRRPQRALRRVRRREGSAGRYRLDAGARGLAHRCRAQVRRAYAHCCEHGPRLCWICACCALRAVNCAQVFIVP
jgi:hypothetical protein